MKIEGILDTGLELNIMSHCIAEKLAKPVNKLDYTNMSNANGGESRLSGIVEGVITTFGKVQLIREFMLVKEEILICY